MAKKSAGEAKPEPSVQGYFRAIFLKNPKLLRERSNEALYQRWLTDHPGQTVVPINVKQGLSNLKSVLRNKNGKRGRNKSSAVEGNGAPTQAGTVRATHGVAAPRRHSSLDRLEAEIDS